jgi:hypothetical protein
MFDLLHDALITLLAYTILWLAVLARLLLRPNRAPAFRVCSPHLLFGEVNIGRCRVAQMRKVLGRLPPPDGPSFCHPTSVQPPVPEQYWSLFTSGTRSAAFGGGRH